VSSTPFPNSADSQFAGQLPEMIGPFRITGVLGRGGMGVVFDAITKDDHRVALKVIRPYGDPERAELLIARFLREAKILESLDHPGVVKLVASGETEGVLYLAMERIEGVSLLTMRRQGPIAFEPLCVLGAQLADALAHMHEAGIIHRDIKPANILIDRSGQPIITDFGISGMNEATGITRQGDLLGSPGFMAPEVIDGATPSPASDQFSLGRLLYELGAHGPAKKLPRGAPILEVLQIALEIDWTRIPSGEGWDDLTPILKRMLATSPRDRFPDARQVLAALRKVAQKDLLDTDTLSEHIGKLPVSTSWEVLASDLIDFEGKESRDQKVDTLPPFPGGPDELEAIARTPKRREPPPSEEEPTQLNIEIQAPSIPVPEISGDVMKPRDLAKLIEPSDFPSKPPIDPNVLRLERQVTRLREEIDRSKERARARAGALPLMATTIVALIAGILTGLAMARLEEPPPPQVVLVASRGDALVEPKYRYHPERGIPSEKDRADAAQMLIAALEHLGRRDLDQAEKLLGMCIEIADLPDCHKTMGTILALTRDPRARSHLLQYVDLAPTAADAAEIRKLVE
jgi:serine/threonine protein kinase